MSLRIEKRIPWRRKQASERPAHSWAANLGPGLGTLGSDNDPSGIVTYSLAGANFGYDMLWVCVLSYPSTVALQLIATRVAAVTGKGLTVNMREHYSPLLFYFAVGRFLFANTLNIAVDILAMGVAAQLLWHGSTPVFAVLFGAASLALQWLIPYARYASLVKWATLAMFAYVGVVFLLNVPWSTVVFQALVPHAIWTEEYFSMLIAVLGTTLSPYLLLSQAEQEVEELTQSKPGRETDRARRVSARQLRNVRVDTLARTAISNAGGFFIMLAAAATLNAAHARLDGIDDAARVLQPLVGAWAPQVLGLALIGSAVLALPPLAGSAAHAVASVGQWHRGPQLDRRIALIVTALMIVGTLLGLSLAALPVNLVKAFYWSALINGMTLAPVLVLLVLLGATRAAVGDLHAHWMTRALCWLAAIVTGGALAVHVVLEFI